MKQQKFCFPSRILFLVMGLMLSLATFAQSIKGTVKDATGEAVIGATVQVVGQAGTGTVTDFDGNFELKVKPGTQLQFSYVGMQNQTVAASDGMIVTLKDDAQMLEQVVVIGYGVAKKNDLTGSVTAIKPDDKNHGLQTSAQDMIQGKIAGVNVTNGGGTPGGGATIRIRGGSSLNASNDPLIVIDGLAMDNQGVKGAPNALSMVNPNDIESFTVLKDASATAIYGSRGSNGVIIITTKKGRKNMAPKVSYNGNVSISTVTKYSNVLNATDYRSFINSYYGSNSVAAATLGNADTDWQKEIYRTAVSTDHNVTVAGGIANMPYRVSVGYTDQNGVLKGSNYQRATASLNLNPSFLKDHLKFNINGKFMYAHTDYANTDAIGAAVSMDPTQPVTSTDAKFNKLGGYYTWTSPAPASMTGWDYIQNTNATKNPVALLNEKDDRAKSLDYMGNIEADYSVHGLEDLHIHMNLSGDWANGKQETEYANWGPTNTYYGNSGYSREFKYNLIYSATVQWMKDFGGSGKEKTQHFDIMGGYEWSHTKYWGDSHYAGLYPTDYGSSADDIAKRGTEYNPSSSKWEQESYLVSFLGRMNYIAWDKYLLTATVRRDGSSRFYNHWATFPAAALSWKVNEEKWLKDVEAVSELKLRLGWGMTGQQDGIGNYGYFATYTQNRTSGNEGRFYPIGNNTEGYLYRPDAYNKELKWETTTTYNIGIDYGFLKNRISGSIDLYYRKTTDLINTAYVPAGSNFRNQVTSNIGSLSNKGVEFSITGRPIQNENWQWEITANFTYNKNEITELTGESSFVKTGGISAGTGNTCQVNMVGYPRQTYYVYQQVYDAAGKPIEGAFVDRNADGQINESDLYPYKSADAPWTGGLSSRLQYKNWDIGFSAHFSIGNYVYNDREASYTNIAKRYDSSFGYTQNVTPTAVYNGWTTYDYVLSDYFVQNASFFKFDSITLGYSFDNLFKGNKYHGLGGRIYLSATNIATITNYSGVDPEISGGIDQTIYPRPLTMLLGLNLNF